MADSTVAQQGPATLVLNAREQTVIHRQLHGLQRGDDQTRWGPWAYANRRDFIVLAVSSTAAIAAGAANPLLTVIFGELAGTFTGFESGSVSADSLMSVTRRFALYYVYLAVAQFLLIYVATVGFYWSGERLVRRMRRTYLKAIIRQNVGFFDTLGTGRVTTHITSDMAAIQEALTSKLPMALTTFANFLSAFLICFLLYWKLALVLCSVFIAMLTVTYITTPLALKYGKASKGLYGSGSSIAQEAIGSIRHATAYGSQKHLADKYATFLRGAERYGVKSRISMAILIGWSSGLPGFAYALGFFTGGIFLSRGETTVAAITGATVAVLNGSFAVVRIIPTTESFVSGMASANAVFEMIGRVSPQDPFSKIGISPAQVVGGFEFKGVELVYPSRPDTRVLKGLDLCIPAGKTTAIIGSSGCGKSSILALLERFYEPTVGSIRLDGHELQALNLRWLRRQIAYVGQEPALFSTTIFENIRHGLVKCRETISTEQASQLVIDAAKLANAHDFILALPKGYETEVGEKGLSLSGGQRQRIAIARAVVSNPSILLLDEATSALDTHSEKSVQRALNNAAEARTTVMIAHRLSTIREADNIIVMKDGQVVEQGSHDSLISQKGAYAGFIRHQRIGETKSEQEENQATMNEMVKLQTQFLHCQYTAPGPTEETALITKTGGESVRSGAGQRVKFSSWLAMKFVLNFSRPELWLLVGGLIASILAGLNLPLQAVCFSETLLAFSYTDTERMTINVNFWALMFTLTGIASMIVTMVNGVCFAYSTERLSSRVRDLTLRSILRQNIAFFDEKAHNTGQLMAQLTSSASELSSMGGAVVGSILTFLSTIISSITLGLAVGWKLALVCMATIPVIAGLGWVRMQIIGVFDGKIRVSGERAAGHASEAVTAIRTVASMGLEDHVLDGYRAIQFEQAAESLPSILRASALYAASQGVNFLVAALVFWYGSSLLASGQYSLTQFFICFIALIWGSQVAGALFNFAPDMSKAALAARDLKVLFDRIPDIDSWNQIGRSVNKDRCRGHLRLENVSFAYPSRPGRNVLHNFDLDITPGSFVALVGSSGCGKSTILGLLERFYDPTRGRITLDGQNIAMLNIDQYRQIFSLVSQEPTVYSGTIRENLLIGLDPDAAVSEDDIIAACKDANIYKFITSLPQGFETTVGSSGSMLSGGQKQRLTIARALLRAPPILLLDEATAALDSESEKLVQKALDTASRKRTTITIAHRLSTVQNADIIYVLHSGRIVEKGSHKELINLRGRYYDLVKMQDLR